MPVVRRAADRWQYEITTEPRMRDPAAATRRARSRTGCPSTSSTRTSTATGRRSSSPPPTSSRRCPGGRDAATCSTRGTEQPAAGADRPGRAPPDLRAARHARRTLRDRRRLPLHRRRATAEDHRVDRDDPSRRSTRREGCSPARCGSSRRPGSTRATRGSPSRRRPTTKGTRLYVGLMAPGASQATLMIRTYASLLQSALVGRRQRRGARPLLDARRVLQQPARARRRTDAGPGRRRRPARSCSPATATPRPLEPDSRIELTSRESSSDDPRAPRSGWSNAYPDADALDVILATNMISVGVDIDRLGLMVVMGQPQSTSEYIQATSRVGRRYPGLVVTLFNAGRSRDRSHYEAFKGYHSALYRQVESTSVTPFSPRARDRGLHAVLIALARLTIPGSPTTTPPARSHDHRAELDLLDRARSSSGSRKVDPDAVDATGAELARVLGAWEQSRDDRRATSCTARSETSTRHCSSTPPEQPTRQIGHVPDALVAARRRPGIQPLPGEELRCGRSREPSAAANSSPPTGSDRSIALGDESFMVAGIDRWPDQPARTCTSLASRRELGVRGFVVPPGQRRRRHPGRALPALALVPEMQTPRRPPRLADVRLEQMRRLQPDPRPVPVRDRLPAWPHRRLPLHALGAPRQPRREGDTRPAHRDARCDRVAARHQDHAAAAAPHARWTRRSTDSRFAT